MVNRGYIEKKKGYVLGRQAYYLTNNFSNEAEIVKCATGPMRNLSDTLEESCVLAVIKNNSRITIHKETFVQQLQANTPDEQHAYHTATGRLLLAYMDPADRNTFISTYGLPNGMWLGIDSERKLIDELLSINKTGFAIHYAESKIVGIAMPIFGKQRAIASLGVYLPESRFNDTKKAAMLSGLKEAAKIISDKIAF